MDSVRVNLGERSYDIAIGSGTLGEAGKRVKGLTKNPRVALISNPTVYGLYGEAVSKALRGAGLEPVEVIIPDGEEYKSLLWIEYIWGELLKAKLDRSSLIAALGGGVIGDMAGFAASAYMRGIGFVQMPTTLLAQVDSSVGGKTGVNHALGKNMIGAFWQPSLVWIDVSTLKTLPRREFISGMAEVIKYGIIRDREFFDFLNANRDGILTLREDLLARIIRRSCEIKADVVSADERESGLRAILNYGHTIGHAIETATGYTKYLHGEAVAIGMCLAARISGLSDVEASEIKTLVESYGLPSELPSGIDPEALLEAMAVDKKSVAGEIRFVLPNSIGSVRVEKTGRQKILSALSGQ